MNVCPFCGEEIPEHDADAHAAGEDAERIACPHQDLAAINARARAYRDDRARRIITSGQW